MANPETYQAVTIVLSTAFVMYFVVLIIKLFMRDF